ncbi:MAG TPA: LLM class flavin-dependent oxidoreductase [Dehalococcoidia bacterium]|jgi:probable F420-dependent oxidoreductase|nr:LLM class flavin-dependent oxidoreductase [Dehalococcoidia bacterium]
MALQFGVNLWPHQWHDVSRIEELGYDSAWTSEHIFFYFPTFDALTSLAAMAARTTRIRLGTAVLLLPLRPAALAAKEIASVDIISGGRVILGVGIGGEYPKEFEAVGVPVRERGARTDEALRVLELLYSEDNVHFNGRFTRLDGVTLAPKPAQPGGPPIWVAGRSEAAIRRAGQFGDAYFPYLFSPKRFHDGLAKAREYAEKAGRDPQSITGAIYQFVALADTYDEAKSLAAVDLSRRYNQPFEKIVDRYVVMGSADDCARRLADFAEAGVEHFILVPIVPAPTDFMPHVEAYARDCVPKMRP